MATNKRTGEKTKERPRKSAVYKDEGAAFVDKLKAVLSAAGDATTPPFITLAALLAAARGVALTLASRPGENGESIYDIGSAYAFIEDLPAEWLRGVTLDVVLPWADAPAVAVRPRLGSKKRKARK